MNLHSMDDRETSVEPKLCSNGENQYAFFDHSGSSLTAFYPKTNTQISDGDNMKCMAIDALEKARAGRNNSIVLETLSGDSSQLISDADSDLKSDTQSSRHQGYADDDILKEEEEEEQQQCLEDLELCEEGVKKKVELLAKMVGVNTTEPGLVLSQVVRFLKDLEGGNGFHCPNEF